MKKAADQSAAFSLGRVLKRHRSNASVSVWLALSPTPRMGCARWPTFRYSPATQGPLHTLDAYMAARPALSGIALQFLADAYFSLGEFGQAIPARAATRAKSSIRHCLDPLASCYGRLSQSTGYRTTWWQATHDTSRLVDRSPPRPAFREPPRISSTVSKDSARRRPPPCQGRSATSGPKMPYVES